MCASDWVASGKIDWQSAVRASYGSRDDVLGSHQHRHKISSHSSLGCLSCPAQDRLHRHVFRPMRNSQSNLEHSRSLTGIYDFVFLLLLYLKFTMLSAVRVMRAATRRGVSSCRPNPTARILGRCLDIFRKQNGRSTRPQLRLLLRCLPALSTVATEPRPACFRIITPHYEVCG